MPTSSLVSMAGPDSVHIATKGHTSTPPDGISTSTPPDGISTSTPPDGISGPHINGHLVSTGMYEDRVQRLFIHASRMAVHDHECHVYFYNVNRPTIDDFTPGDSPKFTVKEHGWFRDLAVFEQVCRNHPVPNGGTPEEIFLNWRDGLLAFLDANHSGDLWTRIV